MYCVNCGDKLIAGEKYCTNCGKKAETTEQKPAGTKKGWHWKTFILTALISSFVWFFYYYGFVDKSSETANIVGHLIETVGRQKQAWTKSEEITLLFNAALSDDCLYTAGCVDDAISEITTLRAEIDKESEEIDNLWSEGVIGNDFEIFFSSLDEKSQVKLIDILDIYFPEEKIDLDSTNQLL